MTGIVGTTELVQDTAEDWQGLVRISCSFLRDFHTLALLFCLIPDGLGLNPLGVSIFRFDKSVQAGVFNVGMVTVRGVQSI